MTPRTGRDRAPRIPLSRQKVLHAAVALADESGLDALTMRKLGEAVGVEAMSLYTHVANKEDLLNGMIDVVFGEIDLPRAAMLLAQATGRLIRNATDRGVVAVFDPRLGKASYRWQVVNALPPMRRTRERAEVESFLREITA